MGDWVKDWAGAVATGFAAVIGLLGAVFGPMLARRQDQARQDHSLSVDATVRGQADLFGAFNQLIQSQQGRIEQLSKHLEGSIRDRHNLWDQIERLTRTANDGERRRSELETQHNIEMAEMRHNLQEANEHLEDCKRDSAELKSRCDRLESELSEMARLIRQPRRPARERHGEQG